MKNQDNTAVELSSMYEALKRQLGEGWTPGVHEPFTVYRKVEDGTIKVRCCTSGYVPQFRVTRFWSEKGVPAVTSEFATLAAALDKVRKLHG